MNRPISTRAHGLIDYAWITTAEALTRMMNGATTTARLVRRAGVAAGFSSMVTNYEAGALRLMPMKGHLAVDAVMCTALILSPLYLPRAERRYAAIPFLLGAVGLIASALTETTSSTESSEGFLPSRELSEAVADPDVMRNPTLRMHLE
jgi:hypothetical protein